MKNKITIILVLLSLVSSVQAGYFWSFGRSGDWADSVVWGGVGVPSVQSWDGDIAIVLDGSVINVTTQGQGSIQAWIGYERNISTVNVAEDIDFEIYYTLALGYGGPGSVATGILNIGQGGSVLCEGLLMSGVAGTHGVINIKDGATLTTNTWQCSVGLEDSSTINIEGNGTMEVRSSTGLVIGSTSQINLGKAGQLAVLGDYSTQLQDYIDNGQITTFGRCVPVLSYHDGYTYVISSNDCSCTTISQGDLNQDCYVDIIDLKMMAAGWLDCTDASDPSCRQE